jgi:hypothetical protein
VTNTLQIIDTATYTKGNHLLKFGGEIPLCSRMLLTQSRGLLQFSPFLTLTNNALGDLLMGFLC